MIPIVPGIAIDKKEIKETFIRSSGPGGQNVNKVSTAVQLTFNVASSPSLSPLVKQRLKTLAGTRMSDAGVLVIHARRFRTRESNRKDALERLVQMIREASEIPKKRKPSRPSRAAKRKRLEDKRRRSMVKQRRRQGTMTD